MRSSKSRSRNNKNRNRSVGNVVNRVFDSSGPEGKVRGTPQQIIDKYNQLARDAQLSGDRVATENFQQHAEHYTRMLAAAQKEMDIKREQQERENRERQQQRHAQQEAEATSEATSADVIVEEDSSGSGLVETPETASDESAAQPVAAQPTADTEEPKKPAKRAPRRPRAKAPAPEKAAEADAPAPAAE